MVSLTNELHPYYSPRHPYYAQHMPSPWDTSKLPCAVQKYLEDTLTLEELTFLGRVREEAERTAWDAA